MESTLIKLTQCMLRIEKAVQDLSKVSQKLAYNTEEATEILSLPDRRKLDEFRKNGLIKGTLTGKGYIYSKEELEHFLRTYKGYNLSNTDNQMIALAQTSKLRR